MLTCDYIVMDNVDMHTCECMHQQTVGYVITANVMLVWYRMMCLTRIGTVCEVCAAADMLKPRRMHRILGVQRTGARPTHCLEASSRD
jgi:hypothetical protein